MVIAITTVTRNVALTAAASGILAVVATLAAPPIALTIGAVGGGLLGWNYMHSRQMTPPTFTPPDASVPGEAMPIAEASFEEMPKVAATTPSRGRMTHSSLLQL